MVTEEQLQARRAEAPAEQQAYVTGLGVYVRSKFDETEKIRQPYEDIWQKDLRQYQGIYEPEIKFGKNKSQVYIRKTRVKVKTMDARLMKMLFPPNDSKNWSIEATPIPRLDKQKYAKLLQDVQTFYEMKKQQAIMQAQQAVSQGAPPDSVQIPPPPSQEEILEVVRQHCKQAATKMSQEIDDQLTDIKYRSIIRDVLHAGNLYGTGILAGPFADFQQKESWAQAINPDTHAYEWTQQEKTIIKPYAEYVRIWDFYPDMAAPSIDSARHNFRRHIMSKEQLLDLAKRQDFKRDAILAYVESTPKGNLKWKDWEQTLWTQGKGEKDALTVPQEDNRYELLEMWGFIDRSEFEAAGEKVHPNMPESMAANIWTIDTTVIKAATKSVRLKGWPYYGYCFDRDPDKIFGEGIPLILRDPQHAHCASVRAMIDNAANTVGNLTEVFSSVFAPNQDVLNVHGDKSLLRSDLPGDPSFAHPGIRTYQRNNHVEMLKFMADFFDFSMDESGIPRYQQGEGMKLRGANQTATGLSMLMAAADVLATDPVDNMDEQVTEPFIRNMYYWNMEFNPKDDIKGDYEVKAKGSKSLIAQEIKTNLEQQLFTNFMNPIVAPFIKWPQFVREICRLNDKNPDDIVFTDEEIRQQQEQAAAAQAEMQAQQGDQFRQILVDELEKRGVKMPELQGQGAVSA